MTASQAWLLIVLFTHSPTHPPFMQLYTMPSEDKCWETMKKGTWPATVAVFCTEDKGKTPELELSAPSSRR